VIEFSRKSQIFPIHVHFVSLKGFSLELGIGAGGRMIWILGCKKAWWYLQPCGYNIRMWQMDTGWQVRLHLCIVSCG